MKRGEEREGGQTWREKARQGGTGGEGAGAHPAHGKQGPELECWDRGAPHPIVPRPSRGLCPGEERAPRAQAGGGLDWQVQRRVGRCSVQWCERGGHSFQFK